MAEVTVVDDTPDPTAESEHAAAVAEGAAAANADQAADAAARATDAADDAASAGTAAVDAAAAAAGAAEESAAAADASGQALAQILEAVNGQTQMIQSLVERMDAPTTTPPVPTSAPKKSHPADKPPAEQKRTFAHRFFGQ